ncbi:MAG TPA: hypothetical protein VG994_06945 [Steroidobacteraceae bacterium]|nr:hypothetical protein [Steroidobacteraceae bacterium]
MKAQISVGIVGMVAAVTLLGCASQSGMSEADIMAIAAANHTASEYRSIIDNASNRVECRREAVTGSRIQREVCVTLAEREAEHERALALIQEMRARAAATPATIRPGGIPVTLPPGRR